MQLTQLLAEISVTLCWRSNVFHCWSCVAVLLLCSTIWKTPSACQWQIHSQIFTNELFLPRLKIIVKMMNTRKDLLCSCYCNFSSLSRSWCSCPLIENESIAYSFSFISQWMTLPHSAHSCCELLPDHKIFSGSGFSGIAKGHKTRLLTKQRK